MVNVYRNVYRTNFANSQDGYISGVIDICYKPFAAPKLSPVVILYKC